MLYHLLTGQDFSFKKEFLFVFMEVELPCFSVDKSLASFLKFPCHTSVFDRFIKSPKLVNYLLRMESVCKRFVLAVEQYLNYWDLILEIFHGSQQITYERLSIIND